MEFGGTESEDSSQDDNEILADLKDNKDKQRTFVESLEGFKIKTLPLKKLVLGIMHRKVNRNFEDHWEFYDDFTDWSDKS